MKLLGQQYDRATLKMLKKYFNEQINTSKKPIIDAIMLSKLSNKKTIFGTDINEGDFLLFGILIDSLTETELKYSFFYCTKEDLSKFKDYYVGNPVEGVPKFIHKNLIKK